MSHPVDKTGDWRARLFGLGFALFNSGKRFEAHEEWEAMWLDEPRGHPNRLFLQGLIQIAAAFHLAATGFPRASFRLFRSARRKLIPYAPSYKGVDVAGLLPHLDRWRERMAAVAAGRAAPATEDFLLTFGGKGWNEPSPAYAGTAEDRAIFKAFEQYSSDRQVTAPCPRCAEVLTVNGRRRAPAEDAESSWSVVCPRSCVSRAYGELRA